MSKYLVLGTGMQGRRIAELLALKSINSTDNVVVVSGIDEAVGKAIEKNYGNPKELKYQYFDVNEIKGHMRSQIGSWFKGFDVVVGAVPSHLGEQCIELAAEYGVNYVDLSFTAADLTKYDSLARISKCTIIPDCGLAPGLPNIVVGKLLSDLSPGEKLPDLEIAVGGISKDKNEKHGYVVSWSLEDLYEEYTREARYVVNGEEKTLNPLDMERWEEYPVTMPDSTSLFLVGFVSDGLRSLLSLKRTIPNMVEKTLRHQGHMGSIRNWLVAGIQNGKYIFISKAAAVEKFKKEYSKTGLDRVVLFVNCGSKQFQLFVDGDEKETAMTKTTAGSCAAVAMTLADDLCYSKSDSTVSIPHGVVMPEVYFSNKAAYSAVTSNLRKTGINIIERG
jgi:saccharopine dehydrogenase-like NADP-dependent oxidoreductase